MAFSSHDFVAFWRVLAKFILRRGGGGLTELINRHVGQCPATRIGRRRRITSDYFWTIESLSVVVRHKNRPLLFILSLFLSLSLSLSLSRARAGNSFLELPQRQRYPRLATWFPETEIKQLPGFRSETQFHGKNFPVPVDNALPRSSSLPFFWGCFGLFFCCCYSLVVSKHRLQTRWRPVLRLSSTARAKSFQPVKRMSATPATAIKPRNVHKNLIEPFSFLSLSLFMLVFFFLCSSPFLVSTRHYETYRRFYRVLLGLTATLYEPYSVFVYYYRVKLSSGDPSRFRVSYFFCLSSICIRFYWILLVEHKDEPSSTNYSQILFRVLASVTCF